MAKFGNLWHITEEMRQFRFSTLTDSESHHNQNINNSICCKLFLLFYLLFLLVLVAHLHIFNTVILLFFLISLFSLFNDAFDNSGCYSRERESENEKKCGSECIL